MRICIFGARAIGGYLAGELALAGHDVCAIARGAHLAAIRNHGGRMSPENSSLSQKWGDRILLWTMEERSGP